MAQGNPAPAPKPAQQTTNPRSGFMVGPDLVGLAANKAFTAPPPAPVRAQMTTARQAPAGQPPPEPKVIQRNVDIPGDPQPDSATNSIMERLRKAKEEAPPDDTQEVAPEPEASNALPEEPTEQVQDVQDVQEKPIDETEKPPTGDKAHRRWVELKKIEKEHRNLKKEIADLKAQKNKTPEENAELQRLKQEREELYNTTQELQKELRAIDIQKDPEFINTIVKPLQSTLSEALQSVPDSVRKDLTEALVSTNRAEMMARIHKMKEVHNLEDWQMDTIRGYANDIIPLAKRYQEATQNAKLYAERREQEREAKAQEFSKRRISVFEEQLKAAESEASLKSHVSDPESHQVIREFMDSLDTPENAARAAIWSHVGPRLQSRVNALEKELASLKSKASTVKKIATVDPQSTGFNTNDDDDPNAPVRFTAGEIAKRFRNAMSQ